MKEKNENLENKKICLKEDFEKLVKRECNDKEFKCLDESLSLAKSICKISNRESIRKFSCDLLEDKLGCSHSSDLDCLAQVLERCYDGEF